MDEFRPKRSMTFFSDIDNIGDLASNEVLMYLSDMDVPEDKDGPSIIDLVVRSAIQQLDTIEQEVLMRSMFQGESIGTIADNLGRSPVSVNNIRIRAIKKLKDMLGDFRSSTGLIDDYNRCVLCSHSLGEKINEFIHVWIDSKDWNLKGLRNAIRREFNVAKETLHVPDVVGHVKFHMNLPGEVLDVQTRTNLEVRSVKRGKKHFNVNLPIPLDIKREIEQLAYEYNHTNTDMYRWAIRLGVSFLRDMLGMNEKMFKMQLELNRVMHRVNRL